LSHVVGRQRLDEKPLRATDGQRTDLSGNGHRSVELGHTVRGLQPTDGRGRRAVRVERDTWTGRPRGQRTRRGASEHLQWSDGSMAEGQGGLRRTHRCHPHRRQVPDPRMSYL